MWPSARSGFQFFVYQDEVIPNATWACFLSFLICFQGDIYLRRRAVKCLELYINENSEKVSRFII